MVTTKIRLACQYCFRDDCDMINEIPPGWTDVSEEQTFEQACATYDGPGETPPPGFSLFDWFTHLGTCPECKAAGCDD